MLNLRKIAVTGGLSSGKSTVCRILKQLGAYTVSADAIVHRLLSSSKTPIGKQIVDLLGPDVVTKGHFNRALIASKVFTDSALLSSLESILHPAVNAEIDMEFHRALIKQAPLFVAEIPLLFETGGKVKYDFTISVLSQQDLCLQRFCQSTGYSQEEFFKRSSRQLSPEEKAKRADFVILNNSTYEDLLEQTKYFFNIFTSLE